MDAPLAKLTRAFIDAALTLNSGLSYLGADEWRRQFETLLIQYHAAAYFAGRGVDALDARGDRLLGATLQTQFDYLARFADSLDNLSEAQINARATLYAGAFKTSYSQGQHPFDLPFYPGDGGTVCMGNCKCEWRIVGERAYWELSGGESCDDCEARARGNPYMV